MYPFQATSAIAAVLYRESEGVPHDPFITFENLQELADELPRVLLFDVTKFSIEIVLEP